MVLSKRYKASDMESGNDTSVLESWTVRTRSNKCHPHERERINRSSFPNKCFTTKNLEITQRERQKIRGFGKELSEGDKWLKRAKEPRSRRWQYSSVVRGKLDSTADSHSDTEESVFKMGSSSVNEVLTSSRTNESDNEGESGLEQFLGFPGQLVSYPPGSDAFRELCKAKATVGEKWGNCVEFAVRTWNDNVIWVKVNCLQRDDEESLDLLFRTVKQSVKSIVERKKSFLDEVTEETEVKLVLEGYGLSRKKRVGSKTDKVRKAQSTRSMAGVDEGKKEISSEEARTKTPGSGSSAQPNLTTNKIAKFFPKKWMLKSLPAPGATESGEVTKEKSRTVESSGEKVVEVRPAAVDNLREVEEGARLATLHGEEDTGKMVARLMKGIWLGIEEERSELKKAKNELEKDLAQAKTEAMKEVRHLKASHVVAISQLQVEAKANLEEMVKECDRLGRHLMLKGYSEEEVDAIKADTYIEEGEDEEAEMVGVVDGLDGVSRQTVFDNQGDDIELPEGGSEKIGMKEANENKEDLYVKAHFRLEKLNLAVFDLTLQVEEKDSEIKKGLEELFEATECAEKLQR
ncbi:hypothetical protein GIB67_006463 [Kingdonia uniflora]|uniref:Uncharacterized protein n=1 Tax=Kingdonia uniflora TaxID=39325 RepID=A0A7J7LEM3_9MAGN|nr:hypothetical protein GIB67_006463 [Kingdonia uniflora]